MTVGDSPEAIVNAALALDRAGRAAEAMAAYERILARWPGLADIWYNLAVLKRAQRDLGGALDAYAKALAAGVGRPEEAHLNRGVIYTDYLGQHEAAEREFNAALACNPRYGPALLNLANLHEDFGRRPEARALLERALGVDPANFEALARLANATAGPDAGALVSRLRSALADAGASAADKAALGFALGRLLDLSADYPAAFRAYSDANRASRASAGTGFVPYDRARQSALTDRLIAAPVPARGAAAAPSRPRPVFICGLFRSGSTLAEQILAGGAGFTPGGELDLLPRIAREALVPFPEALGSLDPARRTALADGYLEELRRRFPGSTTVTDKRPDNFLLLGLVKTLFPNALIVHTVREPLDNCLSIYFLHLDHGMPYALDLMEIGHYFREYRRLMAHWKTCFGDDIHDLNYDALVREPKPALDRLGQFLGVEVAVPEAAAAAPERAIKTASVWQVREPLYKSSSGRARHYEAELAALRAYLADLLPAPAGSP